MTQADAARHADTVRAALPPICDDIPTAWRNQELRAVHAALDALLAQVAAAEQDRDEWKHKARARLQHAFANGRRADAAEQERDRLGNELAQERSKPGGSFDQWARLQAAEHERDEMKSSAYFNQFVERIETAERDSAAARRKMLSNAANLDAAIEQREAAVARADRLETALRKAELNIGNARRVLGSIDDSTDETWPEDARAIAMLNLDEATAGVALALASPAPDHLAELREAYDAAVNDPDGSESTIVFADRELGEAMADEAAPDRDETGETTTRLFGSQARFAADTLKKLFRRLSGSSAKSAPDRAEAE